MTAFRNKEFTAFDVRMIESTIKRCKVDRRKKGIKSGRSRKAFEENNIEVCNILDNRYLPKDIETYKKCDRMEYEYRTGKPAFGFKHYKERFGDPIETI